MLVLLLGYNQGHLPVLIEAPFAFITNVFSEDGLEAAETSWSLDVTNNANDNHGRSLYNSHRLNNFLLVYL